MRDRHEEILLSILSQIKILWQRYDTEFKLVDSETIVASEYDDLSEKLFPFNCFCCQYLFFVHLQNTHDLKRNFPIPFKQWLEFCWQHALKKRIHKLNESNSSLIKAEHNETMGEISSVEDFAMKLTDYTINFLPGINWKDYKIITGGSNEALSYGKKRFLEEDENAEQMELAFFSFISDDFLNAIRKSNPFYNESTSISVLQILDSPWNITTDNTKVTYNDRNIVIYSNDISNETNPLLETDIQNFLDENISRNNSGNIISERSKQSVERSKYNG